MRLIISLLVYNQLEVTKKCIESILENTVTEDYLLIISDNASRPDTKKYLSSLKHKKIKYVRNKENLGFIKAHNNIFNSTKSKYFCVLNNDLIIKTKGWDYKFIHIMEEHFGLAQIGPRQAYGYLGSDGKGCPRKSQGIDYIEGSCFIVNRDYVNTVGGLFEEKYMNFAFCEDADLSLRLRNYGYKIAECIDINILHLHHQSFKNEKVDIDFKKIEMENNLFLRERWKKYLKTRKFEPMRILVIRDGAIGDTFLVTGILPLLKEKYPSCQIFFETSCPQGLVNNPYIIEYGKGLKHKFQYDLTIDLNLVYERKPNIHPINAYAETAGVILKEGEGKPVYYGIDKNNKKKDNTIIVNSEGSWESRTWPLDRWKLFIEYVKEKYKDKTIIEVGSNPSYYLGVGLNLVGKTTFQQTMNLINNSDMYLGMDGSLAHFAQSMNIPTFLIFGCTSPHLRVHNWKITNVVWLDKTKNPCAGCHHDLEEAPKVFTKCKRDKIYCLENITLEMVIDKFERGTKL